MAECNVDDILCEIKALESMRTLKAALGNETFMKEFPELEGLDEKLVGKIQTSGENVRAALAKCGNIELEEMPDVSSYLKTDEASSILAEIEEED